jgi:hypothetical protein
MAVDPAAPYFKPSMVGMALVWREFIRLYSIVELR